MTPLELDYPRMMFHRMHQPVIVLSPEEEAELGPEWSRIVFRPESPQMDLLQTQTPAADSLSPPVSSPYDWAHDGGGAAGPKPKRRARPEKSAKETPDVISQ